jgi:hypothetical protein
MTKLMRADSLKPNQMDFDIFVDITSAKNLIRIIFDVDFDTEQVVSRQFRESATLGACRWLMGSCRGLMVLKMVLECVLYRVRLPFDTIFCKDSSNVIGGMNWCKHL